MGTRADFYVGKGPQAKWLGSLAMDGYPEALPPILIQSHTEALYRAYVERLLAARDDATLPAQGWPWPWNDSNVTDWAYTFDDGAVWGNSFGAGWIRLKEIPDDDEEAMDFWEAYHDTNTSTAFPDMSAVQRVAWDHRSGLIIITSEEADQHE